VREHGEVPPIRFANDADLDALEGIENAADGRFLERFRPEEWQSAPSGTSRAEQSGFLLVSAEREGAEPVGFAHVLERGDEAHLEQLSVLPAVGRRGHGRALVRAALEEAGRRGHGRVTLRTYVDVPWNAPFYAALGFTESEPDTDLLRGLVGMEQRLDLERYCRRVQMSAATGVLGPR
jgi:GNAT superfamily N-acetyltransferase